MRTQQYERRPSPRKKYFQETYTCTAGVTVAASILLALNLNAFFFFFLLAKKAAVSAMVLRIICCYYWYAVLVPIERNQKPQGGEKTERRPWLLLPVVSANLVFTTLQC
jgi:hypothetical protein